MYREAVCMLQFEACVPYLASEHFFVRSIISSSPRLDSLKSMNAASTCVEIPHNLWSLKYLMKGILLNAATAILSYSPCFLKCLISSLQLSSPLK